MLSCEEVSEEEDCCNHQAVISLAEGDAEVDEEEGEQEMLIGVTELMESVRLILSSPLPFGTCLDVCEVNCPDVAEMGL